MHAGVHVHSQDTLKQGAVLQASLDFAGLQVRWVHTARRTFLGLRRFPLLSSRCGHASSRLRRLLLLPDGELFPCVWEQLLHAGHEFGRSHGAEAVGAGLLSARPVVCEEQHLWTYKVAAVPMRNATDRAVVAVVLRLVWRAIDVRLPEELVREDVKPARVSRRTHITLYPCFALLDGHVVGIALGLKCRLLVDVRDIHAAKGAKPRVGSHVPGAYLLKHSVGHHHMIHTLVLCNEIDLVQCDVRVQHKDLVSALERLGCDVVAQVHFADNFPDLVVPRAPEPGTNLSRS
mmetsp:Transcript_21145/g.59142  ORF Transcript_21145/g.59142 Transcript_21145/m.59142 type:complete len:290 (-) Transcript_21145:134-1003(-)